MFAESPHIMWPAANRSKDAVGDPILLDCRLNIVAYHLISGENEEGGLSTCFISQAQGKC